MSDEHCFVDGLQCPPQVLPLHTKSQLVCVPHCPRAPQRCMAVPVAQRVSSWAQTPPQASSTHANWQAVFAPHCPSLQVCTCTLEVHCAVPLLQLPVQTPSLHSAAHAAPSFTHMPSSAQRCGCVPLHCRVPGTQLPAHACPVQTKLHCVASHFPSLEQSSTRRAVGSHFLLPETHSVAGAPAKPITGDPPSPLASTAPAAPECAAEPWPLVPPPPERPDALPPPTAELLPAFPALPPRPEAARLAPPAPPAPPPKVRAGPLQENVPESNAAISSVAPAGMARFARTGCLAACNSRMRFRPRSASRWMDMIHTDTPAAAPSLVRWCNNRRESQALRHTVRDRIEDVSASSSSGTGASCPGLRDRACDNARRNPDQALDRTRMDFHRACWSPRPAEPNECGFA
jgi:hypothetical protein